MTGGANKKSVAPSGTTPIEINNYQDTVLSGSVQCSADRQIIHLLAGRISTVTRDELRDRINSEDVRTTAQRLGVESDKCGKGYVCPECNSGTGRNGTGLHYYSDTNRLHCFACGETYDPVEIIRAANGCDYITALQTGAGMLGIPWGSAIDSPSYRPIKPHQTPQVASQNVQDNEPTCDYTEYLKRAQAALTDASAGAAYLKSRGLRVEVAMATGVGFDSAWRHPNVSDSVPISPRIIIPMDTGGYEARDIRPDDELKRINVLKYKKQSVAPKGTFNAGSLQEADPVHVVEGWADALAVMSAGGHAVALNGTSGSNQLIKTIDSMRERGDAVPPLVLALDVDANGAGQGAQAKFAAELERRNISYSIGTVHLPDPDDPKVMLDPADSWLLDPPMFASRVKQDGEQAISGYSDALAYAGAEELKDAFWKGFVAIIKDGTPRIPTGIESIDEQLGGGLFAGLFVLGGRTGSGKSTLALQIGDSIAMQGRPVLYIALEMSKYELQAKSLARLAYDISMERKEAILNYAQIMEGALQHKTWSVQPLAFMYRDTIAPNMIVHEAIGGTPADVVRQKAEIVRKVRGIAPVIIVDYLQIMGATDLHMTDKQTADTNVLKLKQLSRDLDTPIIAISSMNRAGYKDPNKAIEESDFKESGAIEYTADVLWGLERTDNRGPNVQERWVQLRLLKHRRGALRPPVGFMFRPGPCLFNLYKGAVRMEAEYTQTQQSF